jgi:hypothetical protein
MFHSATGGWRESFTRYQLREAIVGKEGYSGFGAGLPYGLGVFFCWCRRSDGGVPGGTVREEREPVIAVSGRCAARVVADRIVCRARGMEEMIEGCQFFRAQGTTCRSLSTFQPRNGSIGISSAGGAKGNSMFQPRNGSIGIYWTHTIALDRYVSTPQRFDWNETNAETRIA